MDDEFRGLFDVSNDFAYFNCAAIGPLPHAAVRAIEAGAARHARPWQISTVDWVDDVEERRALFAALAGCDADSIALVPSASYGLATAARNLDAGPGQRVLVLAEDFPSSVYTWRAFARRTGCEILTVERAPDRSWTEAILDALDYRVAVVSVPTVHWTDGALVDLEAVGAAARAVGAALVVDASQSFGAMPMDLGMIRPDFMVAVGYKWLLGPYGLSYLFVGEAHLEGTPLEENWLQRAGSEDFARLVDYVDEYRLGARRFDVGERSAFELTKAASASLAMIRDWTIPRVSTRLGWVTERIEVAARDRGLATTSGPIRCPHILGVALPAAATGSAAAIFKSANVQVGYRGRAVRIAPHMYTNRADCLRLIGALAEIAALA
jgi:selenocysteine lyase/cysteine desulfurase